MPWRTAGHGGRASQTRLARQVFWVLAIGALLLFEACADDEGPPATETPSGSSIGASLDHVYRFDEQGALPVGEMSALPVVPGSVTARWYTFDGWLTVSFDGLDGATAAPLCLGTSILNRATRRFEYIAHSATTPEGCVDRTGAGAEILGRYDQGARTCDGVVSYVTRIPSDRDGMLVAALMVFPGDGTGVGISSQFDRSAGPLDEIESSLLDCGPLPAARQVVPDGETDPVLTPLPASSGSVAFTDREPPPRLTEPSSCPQVPPGELHDVTSTAGAPYLVRLPERNRDAAPVVIFLPGGSGSRGAAGTLWDRFFADQSASRDLIVVFPYSDTDLIGESRRVLTVLKEVLWCLGGDADHVHLAGMSNGGLAAFALMAAEPEHFATLLGAPGAFPVQDPTTVDPSVWLARLGGRAVFNGVGANDSDWKPEVIATHSALASAGVESVYVEFSNQGHVTNAGFDAALFFEFWASH
jgi:predicted esterase